MTFHSHSPTLCTALLCCLMISPVDAQRPEQSPNSIRVQYQAFERPASGDSSVVDFLFRIPGHQFVFLRDHANGSFVARGEVFVEFREADGQHIIRDFSTIEIRRQQQVRDQDDIEDYQGMMRLSIPHGEYRAIVEVKDLETGRSFLDRSQRYTFGLSSDSAGILGNPLLVYRDTVSGAFIPFNRGGSVRFGSRGGMIVSVRGDADSLPVSWELSQSYVEGDVKIEPVSGSLTVVRGHIAVSPHPSPRLAYALDDGVNGTWASFYVGLPIEKLEPGAYTLLMTLRDASGSRIRKIEFPVAWEDKPMSLTRFDLSVDALRYIASEEDIDDMIGFMADGGRSRFREFWSRKDPDTTTAYNEVMAEYYRRVDETILRFSTRGELDGYRTDRGRIYILFGAPVSMDRIFRPDTGPREVWDYPSIRKRFIFTDPSRTGEYTLSQTEEL